MTGLKIQRLFTNGQTNPLDDVVYEKRTTRVLKKDGTAVFELVGYDCPVAWSQSAGDIAASKYFVKAGIHGDVTQREMSVRDMVERVAWTIAEEGRKNAYFEGREDYEAFLDELRYILIHQYAAFNSPVWFNYGLFHKYGITGRGGRWVWNPDQKKCVQIENGYERPVGSACYIQSVEDSLPAIFDALKNESNIFSNGSGVGSNFSALRGENEKLSLGGTSSGLISFLRVFDTAAGATKSGGISRRAAKMVCLDMDHPEIEYFIDWKRREEKKAKILIANGFPNDFNGEAYQTVSAQNANNSVRPTDEFMKLVETDGLWSTRLRTTGEIGKTYKAKKLWRDIAESTWECGDPGVQYPDTMNKWNTVPNFAPCRATNPCSEFVHPDDTACNLSSSNLIKFNEHEEFDVSAFRHVNEIMTLAKEIIVGVSSYPTPKIAENSYKLRPLGIGYSNLGALLMLRGIAYDSDEGRKFAALISSLMTAYAYGMSAKIAKIKGPFEHFEANREPMLKVIQMHQDAARDLPVGDGEYLNLQAESVDAWELAFELGSIYGYRNSQASVSAPTGTISFVMDCDTTGIEPDYALVKTKLLAGGGWMKIVNDTIRPSLRRLGYSEKDIEILHAHIMATNGVTGCDLIKEEHISVFDCAQSSGVGQRFIRPMAHVEMMAAIQPFYSGAISKTVNLPSTATVDEIEHIYMEGWKRGLKALALYRDGSKGCQALMMPGEEENVKEAMLSGHTKAEKSSLPNNLSVREESPKRTRQRLPKVRHGITQEATIGNQKVFFTINRYPTGKIGEVFITINDDGGPTSAFAGLLAKSISIGLQHQVPLPEYIEAMHGSKFEPAGMVHGVEGIRFSTSITDLLASVLAAQDGNAGDYTIPEVPHEEPAKPIGLSVQGPQCGVCGRRTFRSGACYICEGCKSTTGCS